MPDLTSRQLSVLRFIQSFKERTGRYATIRDIAAHFEWTSPSTAWEHVKALERQGFLERIQLTAGVSVYWPTEAWWGRG
jgi:SOS-response transcriptional repressor LexA